MITSIQNGKVKRWKKLKKKKDRIATNTFLIEGFHLVKEAYTSDWPITEIVIEDGVTLPEEMKGYLITTVSSSIMKHITDTKTPQGIAAVVQMKEHRWVGFHNVLVVDSLQDPGNLGTMIRTADAAGFEAVLLGRDSVDLYNEKVIRATQGSIFHIPVFQMDLITCIPKLKQEGFSIWVSALTGAISYKTLMTGNKTALVIGNEGVGVADEVLALADYKVKIPIYGEAESLNAGIAAGILMYYITN